MATRGAKKGSTISFYTEKELNIIEKAVKNGKKVKENLTYLSKILGRPESGIYAKYISERKRLGLDSRKRKSPEEAAKTINLSKDMKLQFPAKNIVVENNRIIVYFK